MKKNGLGKVDFEERIKEGQQKSYSEEKLMDF